MNKIQVVIKRQNMNTTILLFSYGVGTTIVLTVMVIRSEYYRHLYHNVAWDHYSLENVKIFFRRMNSVLTELYPLVNQLNKGQGRPATDRRFQLRFVIWWKLFGPRGQQTAVRELNHSPSLQYLLQSPVDPYSRSSLRRFLQDLGEDGFQEIGVTLVKFLIEAKYVTLSRITIDSFPVYSYLNPRKCYRTAPFNRRIAKQIYKQLQLGNILKLFPKQHGRTAPLSDKLKVWLHHFLWDIPSDATNHHLIFAKPNRKTVIRLEKGWKCVDTYRNFLKTVRCLPNRAQIEFALLTETTRILNKLQLVKSINQFQTLNDLRGVFYDPHRFYDRGISLHYCAAKDQHFFGRGGLLVSSPELELPLMVGLTPKYKQSDPQILDFLNKLARSFKTELNYVNVIGDSEFGTQLIKQTLHQYFQATTHIDNYGNSSNRYQYSPTQKQDLKTNERIIGRLTTQHQLERPIVYGESSVSIHLQLAMISDLFIVCYNLMNGNRKHPHSFLPLGGKKF